MNKAKQTETTKTTIRVTGKFICRLANIFFFIIFVPRSVWQRKPKSLAS